MATRCGGPNTGDGSEQPGRHDSEGRQRDRALNADYPLKGIEAAVQPLDIALRGDFAGGLPHRVDGGFRLNGVNSRLFETAHGGESIERGGVQGGQCTRRAPGEIVSECLLSSLAIRGDARGNGARSRSIFRVISASY